MDKIDELMKKRKEREEKEKNLINNVMMSAENLFNSENGIYFLKFLMNTCLWNEQTINIEPNDVIYKKGRRDVWVILRNILPKKILADVEVFK